MMTTTELEAKVLAGEKVTPEQFAQAKMHEEAAARIADLERQKRAKDEHDRRYKDLSERYAKLDKSVDAEAATFDREKLFEVIRKTIHELDAETDRQNAFVDETQRAVRGLRAEMAGPSGRTQISADTGAGSYLTAPSGKRLDYTVNLSDEIRAAVEEALAEIAKNSWQG